MAKRAVRFRLDAVAPKLNLEGEGGLTVEFTLHDLRISLLPSGDAVNAEDSRIVVETIRTAPDPIVDHLERREKYLVAKEREAPAARPAGPQLLKREEVEWDFEPPADLASYMSSIADEMRIAAARLSQLLRWIVHRTGTVQPLIDDRLFWSWTGSHWHGAPRGWDDSVEFFGDLEPRLLTADGVASVQQVLEDPTLDEPLARQVLLEAGSLADSNPRAACVLAVAAAEVGMKQFVARVAAPSEIWLVTEVPSPPLSKMMTDYFQHLLAESDETIKPFAIPKDLRKAIQRGVESRNGIVHRGLEPPNREQLSDLLQAVDEFLYLLDWASGHHWAAKYGPGELRPQGSSE